MVIVSVKSTEKSFTPDELIEAVHKANLDANASASLGEPISAKRTFGDFVYPKWVVIADDSALKNMALYVTLGYPSESLADAAEVLLATDERFGFVGRATGDGFSPASHPNDQFYTRPFGAMPDETGYQWGMYALNLADAWNVTPGWGRIGIMDAGPEVGHPDLQGRMSYFGSYDVGRFNRVAGAPSSPVAGRQIAPWFSPQHPRAHGTHVVGIAMANANNPTSPPSANSIGVSGACQECSWLQGSSGQLTERLFTGRWLPQWGAQVTNLSGAIYVTSSGAQSLPPGSNCAAYGYNPDQGAHPFCQILLHMDQRDSVLVAASGNHKSFVLFPARDPLAVSVGATDVLGNLWDEGIYGQEIGDWPNGCPVYGNSTSGTTFECGSNSGAEQDFVAPGRKIVSTITPSPIVYAPYICADDTFSGSGDGYGYCTGTSMSAPHISGIIGLARSIHPLLSKNDLLSLMRATASGGGIHNQQLGYGLPNAGSLTDRVLGKSNGIQLRNRLTPMFVLRNLEDKDRLYTTNPTLATAAVYGEYMVTPDCVITHPPSPLPDELVCPMVGDQALARPYSLEGISGTEAQAVPSFSNAPWDGYHFPAVGRVPNVPSASFYVFTTPQSAFGVAMLPLEKLAFAHPCDWRDHVYTTSPTTANYYKTTDFCGTNSSYKSDGIEGYVMASCPSSVNGVSTNGCTNYADRSLPQPLYLRYNTSPGVESYALLLGSQLTLPEFQGYQPLVGRQHLVGYVFPNQDSDQDFLIDGQERLLGTSHLHADTDCDGSFDGDEYPPFGFQALSADPATPSLCSNLKLTLTAQMLNQSASSREIRYTMTIQNLSGPAATEVAVNFNWAQRDLMTSTFIAPSSPAQCVDSPLSVAGIQTKAIPELIWRDRCPLDPIPSGSTRIIQLDVTSYGDPLPTNTGGVTMTVVHSANDAVPANNTAVWNP